eukprot:5757600-Amphidinium_carterae.2
MQRQSSTTQGSSTPHSAELSRPALAAASNWGCEVENLVECVQVSPCACGRKQDHTPPEFSGAAGTYGGREGHGGVLVMLAPLLWPAAPRRGVGRNM